MTRLASCGMESEVSTDGSDRHGSVPVPTLGMEGIGGRGAAVEAVGGTLIMIVTPGSRTADAPLALKNRRNKPSRTVMLVLE